MSIAEEEELELLSLLLEEEGIKSETDLSLIKKQGLTEAPASFQQQRLWFLHELEPTSSAYNICTLLRLDGLLQVQALQEAFKQLQQRHETLRTTFADVDGAPWQRIHKSPLAEMLVEDWSDIPELDAKLQAIASSEGAHQFNLETGPLLRSRLFRVREDRHFLSLTLHHIIADAWSIGILLQELAALYEFTRKGLEPTLEELKIQYADYAAWQQETNSPTALAAHLAYWEKQLAELPVLQFPTDFPRPRLQTFQGDLVSFTIPLALTEQVRTFSQGENTTPFVTLLAAFAILLTRYSRQTDFPIGTSIANRPMDAENIVGFFVNMLVMRIKMSQEPSFKSLVRDVKNTVLTAFEHAEVPFESLVNSLNLERDTSRNPLFQIAFTLLNAPQPDVESTSLKVTSLGNQEAARFDLEMFITEMAEGLSGVLSYNIDLFVRETVERFARHFCYLLENAIAQPEEPISQLPLLLPEEEVQLKLLSQRQIFPVDCCLHQVFSKQVRSHHNRTALIYENVSLTYGELNDRANSLARHLRDLGVGPEVRVGILVHRSWEMVACILAVLKAGGVYVPFDPDYPPDRVSYMMADSQVRVLLTQSTFTAASTTGVTVVEIDRADLFAEKVSDPNLKIDPDNAAYIIYTSGSTGKPKGVVVTHRNAVRLMLATEDWFHFNAGDLWTLFHSIAFDFSVWELWGAFFYGGRLLVVPYLTSRSPEDFYNLLCDRGVTVLNQTPSAFRQLMQAEALLGREGDLALRYVIFGGEALELSSLEAWFDRHPDDFPLLVNMYGITETTVHVTYRPIRFGDVKKRLNSVIGVPIPDLSLYLLDDRGQQVPLGVVGEIHVGGGGVTRGYLNRPELTAERMVANPFDGDRLYKTGDLARYLANGELEYIGRKDFQVKVRGFRIELGEIIAEIAEVPGVRSSHVITTSNSDNVQIVAYVVPQANFTKIPGYESLAREQVSEWQYTFDDTYSANSNIPDVDFNIAGWNSSYDGKAIPAVEMRAWLNSTLERIQALKPRRVLEIGCGTGMLLLHISPSVEVYWGTDFSARTIENLSEIVKARSLAGVRLLHREAIDFTDIPEAYFDTVIINSVAQYFPSMEYLEETIAGALRTLGPGGSLFIGDNRSMPHLPLFHASVAFSQADDREDRIAFSTRLGQIVQKENELVLDPSFFVNLPQSHGEIEGVEIHLKDSPYCNELTKYRYDAVLFKTGDRAISLVPVWQPWEPMQVSDLRDVIARQEAVGWYGIPNARLLADEAIARWESGEEHLECQTVGELRQLLSQKENELAVDPADLYELAAEIGCQVAICYSRETASGKSSCFDACFWWETDGENQGRSPQMPMVGMKEPFGKNRTFNDKQFHAINPLQERFARELIAKVKERTKSKLPEYMQPSAFVLLEDIPLTPSGKIDKRQLPEPTRERLWRGEDKTFVAPQTPTQVKLCDLWSDVLGVDRLGAADDFFQLGGHSLLATKLVSRIRESFYVALPLRALFEYPTIAAQAEQIDFLNGQGDRMAETDRISPLAKRDNIPLSFSQQRLWFLDRLEPNSSAYNIALEFQIDGQLNKSALYQSLQEIVKRHEVLRTTFTTIDSNPVQVIRDWDLELHSIDLSSATQPEQALKAAATEEILRPFDLETGPLFRINLYGLAENTHVFLAVVHHIVSDGWSWGLITKELSELYIAFCQGKASPLVPLSLQYADFAHWQRTTWTETELPKQLAYWKKVFAGDLEPLALPTDFPRPPIASYAGSEVTFSIAPDLSDRFQQLCEGRGATLFMGLLAVFNLLLMRYTGQKDIVVGTPIANRNRRETERLIGFFVNTLAIRTDLKGQLTFATLLERVKEKTLQAYAHQDLPFEKLVEELHPERHLSHNPLFQVMLILQNAPMGDLQLPDIQLKSLPLEQMTSHFDFSLSITETSAGLQGRWEYKTDLFLESTIYRAIGHFQTLLSGVVANADALISELPLLTAGELWQLQTQWNPSPVDYPQISLIHRLFEAQVAGSPDAIAVTSTTKEQLTYRELNDRANQLAHYLQSLGVKPETLVGICVDRSPEMLVAIFGILKAGGAYIPLDPAYPKERLQFMLGDAGARILLTQGRLETSLTAVQVIDLDRDWQAIASYPQDNPESKVQAENLAYVIYTSGSTGKPKGVTIAHQSLVNFTQTAIQVYGWESSDRVLQFFSLSFDGTVEEIYASLCCGATLVLRSNEMLRSAATFLQQSQELGVTIWDLPTAYWHQLTTELVAEKLTLPESLQKVIVSGEQMRSDLTSMWQNHVGDGPLLINAYGPSETTVLATVYKVPSSNTELLKVPIGRIVPHLQLYVLDEDLQQLPVGVSGQLYIGGNSLSRGYFNRPKLTGERFIPHPFSQRPGDRLYGTGDLVRYLPDGNLEFCGRTDNQVKIRGFRVELGEIETALTQHPDIRESIVIEDEDKLGNKRLIAYAVPLDRQNQTLDLTFKLRHFLQQQLPDYAIPNFIILLDELPLSPNGKLDRKALPKPQVEDNRSGIITARNSIEHQLLEMWESLLEVSPISVTDNFFELGGHSLLAIRLISAIEKQLGRSIPLATLFREATVEAIAVALAKDGNSDSVTDRLVPLQTQGDKLPLFLTSPAAGYAFTYTAMARLMGKQRPIYALQARGLDGEQAPLDNMEAIAWDYIEAMGTRWDGPYILGGYSFGGLVAFEMAAQLEAAGLTVKQVLIIDAHPPVLELEDEASLNDDAAILAFLAEQIGLHFHQTVKIDREELTTINAAERLDYVNRILRSQGLVPPNSGSNMLKGLMNVYKANSWANIRYQPKAIKADISLFKTAEVAKIFPLDVTAGWGALTTGTVTVWDIIGEHLDLMQEPNVTTLKIAIEEAINRFYL